MDKYTLEICFEIEAVCEGEHCESAEDIQSNAIDEYVKSIKKYFDNHLAKQIAKLIKAPVSCEVEAPWDDSVFVTIESVRDFKKYAEKVVDIFREYKDFYEGSAEEEVELYKSTEYYDRSMECWYPDEKYLGTETIECHIEVGDIYMNDYTYDIVEDGVKGNAS